MIALRALTALLVALFVGGAGLQDTLLLCRSLQTTHRTCCCSHTWKMPALGDELSRAPCCDAAAVEAPAIPPTGGAAPVFFAASPVLLETAAAPRALLAVDAPTARAARWTTPLATGPPLHIRHHALLI